MNSNIIQGTEYLEGMMNGIAKATAVIRPTYGGAGSNIIIESTKQPYHMVANDCETIVQAIHLTDPAEKRGLAFIKELSSRTDRMSGDNRKTTVILMEEILKGGSKVDMPKLQLKRELDALIPFIESEIDKQTRQITVDTVAAVATTASESEEIGTLLQEIYQKIGKDGMIDVIGSGTFETSYEITKGQKFDMAEILSPYMFHDDQAIKDGVKETSAVYEKPLILVTKKKINSDEDINPILQELRNQDKKDLVIFAQDMDSGVASMLIELHKSKQFNICIIKAPSLWRDFYFEDFAQCTDATVVEDSSGLTLRKLPFSALGTCDKIIVDQEKTIVIGGKDITDHIARIENSQDNDSKVRLIWLKNKTAVLRLGSNGETDLSYKRLKTNDAVRSSQLALKYGIVAGGGVALMNVAIELPKNPVCDMLFQVLQAPVKQIITNYGLEPKKDIALSGCIRTMGFNTKDGTMTDMFEAGIIDSAMTLKFAVRNAIGIASTILTASGLVYIPAKTPEEIAYEVAMSKNYAF